MQNVSTPRIYLNIIEYLMTTSTLPSFIDVEFYSDYSGTDAISDVYRTLPVGEYTLNANTHTLPTWVNNESSEILELLDYININKPYLAFLGHDLSDQTLLLQNASVTPIINGESGSFKNGFTIIECTGVPTAYTFSETATIGSILFGTFYDFPNSPDLSLSISYEYDGVKETTTKGGATLTNAYYTKPPAWLGGRLGAWELGGNPVFSKSGRRVWDLSFSYMADTSIFPTLAALTNENEDATVDHTLFDDDTFQRVIHLTNGGQLPFIFQPDGTKDSNENYNNAKQDSFAIAKFDMNSFELKQVANNVYNVKIKIREVW